MRGATVVNRVITILDAFQKAQWEIKSIPNPFGTGTDRDRGPELNPDETAKAAATSLNQGPRRMRFWFRKPKIHWEVMDA